MKIFILGLRVDASISIISGNGWSRKGAGLGARRCLNANRMRGSDVCDGCVGWQGPRESSGHEEESLPSGQRQITSAVIGYCCRHDFLNNNLGRFERMKPE